MAAGLVIATQLAAATPADGEGAWARLRFEHEGLALDATLDISRESAASTAFPATEAAPEAALRPSGAALGKLTVDSHFRLSPFLERRRHAALWFEPASHAALLGTRETTGIGAGYRVSRYAADGVHVTKAAPATAAERRLAPAAWRAREHSRVDYGSAASACASVTEPTALLLRDPAVPNGEGPGLCVISRKQLLRPVFTGTGEAAAAMGYRLHGAGGAVSEVAVRRVLRYTLRLVPLGGGDEAGDDGYFLGLDGDIELEVEPASGMPLRLRGRAALLGRVDFRLREAWRAQSPSTPRASSR